MARELKVRWEGNEVTALCEGDGDRGILLAHGAGTNQRHATMVLLRGALAAAGHTVMTFDYPYTERGSRRPDRTDRLVDCHRAAADLLRHEVERLFLAGRSMGGRMGTYLAAEGYDCDGLILYSYPLHPAGKPEKLRVAHFPDVRQPMLFFVGTRDPLSRLELFDRHVRPLPNAEVIVLDGANHGFTGGGWSPEKMVSRLVEGTTTFVSDVSSGNSPRSTP